MINLLPTDVKLGYQYARRNVRLRRWVTMCLVALIGLGAITTYGLLTIHQSTTHYTKQIAASEARFKQEDFTGTQKQVQDISNSFKLLVKVLSKEVLFSSLIKQIGASMPDNANLTGLSISQTQGGIAITANATDYKTATQVQVNLADPNNKIFSKADIESITCASNSNADPTHPCIVVVRALFATNNPFLFINSQGRTSHGR
jgi:Tfp pilus assembly protein PilN